MPRFSHKRERRCYVQSVMLLQEQMEDVAELKQWLKKKKKVKYLSPAIANELLNDFSPGVLTKLQQDN